MNPNYTATILLTGIPRSGTTLCCKLLNEREDTVALHEPINPPSIPDLKGKPAVAAHLSQRVAALRQAIIDGEAFEHGDKGGLRIENPVGMETRGAVRQVVAQRGMVTLPPRSSDSFTLVVKQNALFTAHFTELKRHYPVVAIVRNPVDVLLSWMTVDLPVNRGRLPAGERFCPELKRQLAGEKNLFARQLLIYKWFSDVFLQHADAIVRYEAVLESGGAVLDNALRLPVLQRSTSLSRQERVFSSSVLAALSSNRSGLLALAQERLYSKQQICDRLSAIGV
ncbi:sulfotransferase [Bowmanella pacifica]|uniref:sulfotransferase n=1 Tax=Bowmanella pacifica TaxID=502051 RepID=UPI001664A67A|nr:sulfotransferase [Bowmanella pacifica]